jgi:Histidine kinase-, DNA gyrase B-, and HSP90-like ATPase
MESVSLPNSFFVKSCRDYAEPRRAFIREFIQNSRDAGATEINLSVVETPEGIRFECRDNGRGMDEDTLRNKLMALGESSKTGATGVAGGFGVAKILIFFAQNSYRIRSRDYVAEGVGGTYAVTSGLDEAVGVHAEVILNGDVFGCDAQTLVNIWTNELSRSNLSPDIFLNGVKLDCNRARGRRYQTLTWCRVYRRKIEGRLYSASVRCLGLHMFDLHLPISMAWEVVIEVDGFSTEIFTTNRDSFKRELQEEILNVLADLESGQPPRKNRGSQRQDKALSEVLDQIQARQQAGELNLPGLSESISSAFSHLSPTRVMDLARKIMAQPDVDGQSRIIESIIEGDHDFAIEVLGRDRLPAAWHPDRFSRQMEGLRHMWREMCEMVADHIHHTDEFTTGFVLDLLDDKDATVEGLQVFHPGAIPAVYINPTIFLAYAKTVSPEAALMHMVSVATHEICHLRGNDGHGQRFASEEMLIRSHVYQNLGAYLSRAEFWYRTLFPRSAKTATVFQSHFQQLALF